jgi:hypothetical protein
MSQRKPTAPRKPRAPKSPPDKPFKIVGQLIGARHDKDGNIIGEWVMGEIVFYRPQFDDVRKLVDDAVKLARERQG